MPTITKKLGSTSVIIPVFILDSAVATGAGKTALTFSDVTCYFKRDTAATATAVTLETIAALGTYAVSTSAKGGFKLIDDTNMPGEYEFHAPDDAFSASSAAKSVSFLIKGTGIAPCRIFVELTAVDNQDGVRYGLTALPNAAAAASGGLPTIGVTIPNATAGAAGGLFIAGTNAATTVTTSFTTTFTGNLTGSVASVTGAVGSVTGAVGSVTGAVGSVTGAVGSVTGNVGGNVVGSVASVTAAVTLPANPPAGFLVTASYGTAPAWYASPPAAATIATTIWQDTTAGDFTTPGSIGLRLTTGVPAIAPGAAGGLFIAGSNAATSITTALTANITGNLSGSVGSVSGNVSGSVGSVVSGIPTPAQIATGVWQDATAGDFTTLSSIGLRLTTGIPAVTPGNAGGLFIAGTNAATTITTALTTTFTGNLSGNVTGSVASVTGAVGSVTGNVGGNVVGSVASVTGNVAGSVASVTGAVGSVTGNVGGNVTGTVASVVTKTGYVLASTGLDSVIIDTALNARQSLALCSSALAGRVSGAGTGTVLFQAMDDNLTNRITASVDANGNRTSVTLNPPA